MGWESEPHHFRHNTQYKPKHIKLYRAPEMGNKLKQSSIFSKTAMSAIGSVSICPNCQQSFPPTTTYQNFDQHVTQCLENFRPTDQERLRMQRRKKSKDSRDSQDGEDNHDYVTIEVYVRKKSNQTKLELVSQHKHIQSKEQMGGNGDHSRRKEQDNKSAVRSSRWMKSQLTYSESLLSSLSLAEISKQGPAYKILWFHHRMSNKRITWKQGAEVLTFHPDRIVRDSLALRNINLYKELKIVVLNDVVHDAGGLLREWAVMLLNQLITEFGLFVRNKQGYYTLNPQLASTNKLKQTVTWHQSPPPQKSPKTPQLLPVPTLPLPLPLPQISAQQFQLFKAYYKNHMQNMQNQQELQQEYGSELVINSKSGRGYVGSVGDGVGGGKVTYRDLYQLFACLLAKIVIEKVTVPVGFDWVFLGNLLATHVEFDLHALSTYDKQISDSVAYLNQLSNTLKNPKCPSYPQKLQQLQSLCLTFSVPATKHTPQHELTPNGKNIQIQTAENLQKYLKLLQKYYSSTLHFQQQKIIRQKFYSIIRADNFDGLFLCDQFQLLVNGVSGHDINVRDWQEGTEYREPYHKDHKVIKYFWAVVDRMTGEDKMRLLKFVTGSERLPVYGFKNLETNRGETSHFVIQAIKYDKKTESLPKAHTCFNRLVLPTYPNESTLAQHLLAVIHGNFDGVWGMQ